MEEMIAYHYKDMHQMPRKIFNLKELTEDHTNHKGCAEQGQGEMKLA